MVLIDTSVWISLYRKKATRLGEFIWSLVAKNEAAICGQVWIEFLGGFRRKERFEHFESLLKGFPFVETTFGAYRIAARLVSEYPKIGSGDAVIAATAIASDMPMLTLDNDFNILRKMGLHLLDVP